MECSAGAVMHIVEKVEEMKVRMVLQPADSGAEEVKMQV